LFIVCVSLLIVIILGFYLVFAGGAVLCGSGENASLWYL